ncbi:MAG: hypothetical protein U5K76_16020 [Woeseiaceae bacterium]|nr:hypothetical protein [Woeseiaceae bacterium]
MTRLACFAAAMLTTVAVAQTTDEENADPGFNEATFKGLEPRNIGPALMSGRIADVAIDPSNPN